MEDGVEVIVNCLEPYKIKGEPSTFHLEEEFTIDTERNDIVKIGLSDITGFDVDSGGNIYFYSFKTKENFIFKFDRNANFITSFARKGQGPGEIQLSFYYHPKNVIFRDRIILTDKGGKKLLIFEKGGNFIKQIPINPDIDEAHLLENGKYLVIKRLISSSTDYLYQIPLSLASSEFEEIRELDRKKIPNVFAVNEFDGSLMYILFWSVSNGKIYVGNEERGYEIWVYDFEGNFVKKIRKEYKSVKVSVEYKKEFLKPFVGPENEPQRKKIYFSEFWPPFQYFFADDEGRLFVMTYEKAKNSKEYVYDIFNEDGFFIGKTRLENFGNVGDVVSRPLDVKAKKNRLYCLQEKESGYKELVVYKMNWE